MHNKSTSSVAISVQLYKFEAVLKNFLFRGFYNLCYNEIFSLKIPSHKLASQLKSRLVTSTLTSTPLNNLFGGHVHG